MITIRINNPREAVRRHKGWLASVVGDRFLDLETEVERRVVAQLRETLAEAGIEAEIERVPEAD